MSTVMDESNYATTQYQGGWLDFFFPQNPVIKTEPINETFLPVTENVTLDGEELTTQLVDLFSTVLVPETSTAHPEFLCVKDEWTEPDFPRYACSGSKITSWIATVFLISMIIFGVVKCLATHGVRNIFDLRLNGVSFPKRPEFFVLLCSSLPLVFSTLSRPLFTPLSLHHDIFIRGWGMAQTRFFLDLFTRSASIYHLVYWTYRTPIITVLWRTKLAIDHYYTLWRNRPKPSPKPRKSLISSKVLILGKASNKPPPSRGRTTEHGTGKKRRRSKSTRSNRSNDKPPSQASSDQGGSGINAKDSSTANLQAPVITAGGMSLIAPQPLFPVQPAGMPNFGMVGTMPGMNSMNPFGQSVPGTYQYGINGYNMYGPVSVGTGQSGMTPGMGYGMSLGYGMGMGIGMGLSNQGFAQQPSMYPISQSTTPMSDQSTLDMHQTTTEMTNLLDGNQTEAHSKAKKEPVVHPPPSRPFMVFCKRLIPGFIYLGSLVATLPSVLAFEVEPNEQRFVAARCTQMCRSYFYYDLVVLVTVPTILMIVGFFHGVLSKTQLNGGSKMTYRLRCYYVTFILLNIPMFVLMLTSIGFRLTQKPYRNIYGTGILIALTAYHANFALKSTVYTTACNCICCSDSCLHRVPVMNRFITFFTTPVAVNDRERLFEGSVIPVQMDGDPKSEQK
ncbi:hypothetical protein FGIG_08806 [Fasciola gigantica]|uniref:Transmembrane protein n=1 Tax=Fasciola gigantica TaxID=46835 RepID=A0A504YBT9_FASGI|nr:hypothetical protein FGIG_08806 [Fasciola gigantica]